MIKSTHLRAASIVIAVLLIAYFAFTYGKSIGNSDISSYKAENDRLKKDVEVLNDSILQNKIQRSLLRNKIASVEQERDSLIEVKTKIKVVHDEKINAINNASNDDIVELFTGFNPD